MLTLLKIPPFPFSPHSPTIANQPVDFRYVTKVKLDVNNEINPTLWVIYLYGTSPNATANRESLKAIWFFQSEKEQLLAIENIFEKHLHVLIK